MGGEKNPFGVDDEQANRWSLLSDRQRQIFYYLTQGETTQGIARTLAVGVGTVRTHIRRIAEKFEIDDDLRIRHWKWVGFRDVGNPSFHVPDEIVHLGMPIIFDEAAFITEHSSRADGLYPLSDVYLELGTHYLRLYYLLWKGLTLPEVGTATHYSPITLSYHVEKLKAFFAERTNFSSAIALRLGISRDSLRNRTHLTSWVESRRLALTEEEKEIYLIALSHAPTSGGLNHEKLTILLNEFIAGKYRAKYHRRTVTHLLHSIAKKHEAPPNLFWSNPQEATL